MTAPRFVIADTTSGTTVEGVLEDGVLVLRGDRVAERVAELRAMAAPKASGGPRLLQWATGGGAMRSGYIFSLAIDPRDAEAHARLQLEAAVVPPPALVRGELGPVGASVRCETPADVARAFGITEHGERVPPEPGDSPCGEYDPAGPGAGVEEDGHPQCATCGFSLAAHEAAGPPSGTRVADHLHQECHICAAAPGQPCDPEIHARYARGEDTDV